MGVCFVVERFGKPSETFVRREFIELARRDEDFFVYCLHRPRPGDVEVPEALEDRVHFAPGVFSFGTFFSKLRWFITHPIRMLLCVDLLFRALLRPLRSLRELVGAKRAYRLASLARKYRAERIHAEFATAPATVAWVASRVSRVPFSVSVHAWDVFVYRTMLKSKLRAADMVVACSECALRYVVERLGVPEKKTRLVHHGLDLEEFSYSPARADCPPLRILAVGRLVKKKGFGDLVEAVSALRRKGFQLECTIVGEGPLEAKLQKRIASLSVSDVVALAGGIDEEEVAEGLLEAHVLVAPSVEPWGGDRDGIPNVILEAMARGTPVVTTDAGGIPEVARDGETALVVPQNAPDELAAAIRRTVEEPALARELTEGARKLVQAEFDVAKNAPRLLDVLYGEEEE